MILRKILLTAFISSSFTFATAQLGEWTWIQGQSTNNGGAFYGTKGVGTAITRPSAIYEGAQWTDSNDNFWLFGGQNDVWNAKYYCDVWKYDPNTNNWTWMHGPGAPNNLGVYGTKGVSSPTNYPGSRGYAPASWVDKNGNFWLFGGAGYDSFSPFAQALNDLWKYNPTTNEWTWMSGSQFGSQSGVYGTMGVPSAANTPGARSETFATWIDNSGNLWMYGGFGYDGLGFNGSLSDLWKYDIITNEWTWMGGQNITNATPVYGTKGVAAATNFPGQRHPYAKWTDDNGNFWMFGGTYLDFFFQNYYLNDMWKLNTSTLEWTWMSGTNLVNDTVGVYGTQCVPSINNVPSARYENKGAWKDCAGNFWMFGGMRGGAWQVGLNDLWHYNVTTNEWTWVEGSSTSNTLANYGTKGVSAPTNDPGPRGGSSPFMNSKGEIWIYGGTANNTSSAYLNFKGDLWRYIPDPNCPFVARDTATATFTADNNECILNPINFTGSTVSSSGFVWNFGDGQTSTLANPQHAYTTSGTYTVSLIAGINVYCTVSDTAQQTIVIEDPKTITGNFTADTVVCVGTASNFINASINATSYIWNFGDGQASILTDPSHAYTDSGYYSVSLIAIDNISPCNNPNDTLIKLHYVYAKTCLFIPNVFSPNNDGQNDVFKVLAEGYKSYHVEIYDRWGLKMFETNDSKTYWNGKIDNSKGEAPDGTYYYIVKLTNSKDEVEDFKGYLTLVTGK